MVLFEIDPEGVTRLEFKRDAPRAIDVNRVAGGVEPSRRMKVK
jgi:hypothetical protein